MKIEVKDGKCEQVEKYLNTVIEDSAKSEQRPNDVRFEYLIVDDNLLFAMKSGFQRVMYRISYRLSHNLFKNFGVHFNLIYPWGYSWHDVSTEPGSICNELDGYGNPVGDIDPNHSFMTWEFFGKKVTIRSVYGIRPDAELGTPHLEKLAACGYDYDGTQLWEDFERAYNAAYGESLLDGARREIKRYRAIHKEKNKQEVNK